MIHQFLMFLAPENAAPQGLMQATTLKPPANLSQFTASVPAAAPARVHTARFMVSVVVDAIGFAIFIAGCWLCLQLLQTYL
jgi:hypothetical protein